MRRLVTLRLEIPSISSKMHNLLLYCVFILNLLFFLVDAVYNMTHSYIHYLLLTVSVCMMLSFRKLRTDLRFLSMYLGCTVLGLVALGLNGSGIGNIVQMLWPMTLILVYGYNRLETNFYKNVAAIATVFLFLFALKAVLVYSKIDYTSLADIHEVHVVNPNSAGMLLVYLYLISDLGNDSSFSGMKLVKLLAVIIGLIQCGARASMIAFAGVILIGCFKKQICNNRKILILIVCSIIVLGTLFPFIYVEVYKSGVLGNVPILGKSFFTGRQLIWMRLFSYIEEHPITYLIGTGYNTSFYISSLGSAGFNLHNAYLMFFAQYGLVVTVLYLFLILNTIWRAYYCGHLEQVQLKAAMILLFTLILGFGEITLSYNATLIFPGMALGILRNKKRVSAYADSKSDPLLLV